MMGTFLIRVGGHPDNCGERTWKSIKKPDWAFCPVRLWLHKLENQFQGKLDQPFLCSSAANNGFRYFTESIVKWVGPTAGESRIVAIEAFCWGREGRMVEQIEELRPELKTHSLGNRCPLEQCYVPVVGAWHPEVGIHAGLITKTPIRRGCK